MRAWVRSAAILLAFTALPARAQHTAEGCTTFTWNLAREFAALRSASIAVAAADGSTPTLEPGKHYSATLAPQETVSFRATPARARKIEKAMAGVFQLRSGKAGRYRIALSSRHWIDVLDGGKTIDSVAHEGRSGCDLLHKVVEFELPADRKLTLQLSGAEAKSVDVVITGPA